MRRAQKPCDHCQDKQYPARYRALFDRFLCDDCHEWARSVKDPAAAVAEIDTPAILRQPFNPEVSER